MDRRIIESIIEKSRVMLNSKIFSSIDAYEDESLIDIYISYINDIKELASNIVILCSLNSVTINEKDINIQNVIKNYKK